MKCDSLVYSLAFGNAPLSVAAILLSMKISSYFPIGRGAVVIALIHTLAACGGGDPEAEQGLANSHTVSTETAGPAPDVVQDGTPPTRENTAALSAANTCSLSNFQAEAMQRINAYRARGASCGAYGTFGPTAALQWSGALQDAAAKHSTDMASKNFFSHTGSDGSNAGTRITRAGYSWSAWGENIAAGQTSIQAVVDGWMKSPGHCANIMKPTFKHVGLACVKGSSTNTYSTYWTMDLAKPR